MGLFDLDPLSIPTARRTPVGWQPFSETPSCTGLPLPVHPYRRPTPRDPPATALIALADEEHDPLKWEPLAEALSLLSGSCRVDAALRCLRTRIERAQQ